MAEFIAGFCRKTGANAHKWRLLCSTARRTRETATNIQNRLPGLKLELLDELYQCQAETIASILDLIPDEIETVIVVGHNPAVSVLAGELSANPDICLGRGDIVIGSVPAWQNINQLSLIAHDRG